MKYFSLFIFLINLFLITVNCQEGNNLDVLNGNNKASDLDSRNEEGNSASAVNSANTDVNEEKEINKQDKPRKTTFKEERFEKLFSNRNRKPRLPPPKFNLKPKPKLPSYLKNVPSVKPLGQNGLPIEETTPKPVNTVNTRVKSNLNKSNKVTTQSSFSNNRSRNSSNRSSSTTIKPDLGEDSKKKFSSNRRSNTLNRNRNN